MNSYLTEEELLQIGFKSIGKNVMLSKKASIYRAERISIGSNVRIDDFCILSGTITIGNYIHIAAYSALYGSDVGIQLDDFSNISSRVCIYAISDDFSGEMMTNPLIPDKYKRMIKARVHVEKHVIIGTGSTILPDVTLREGTAVGAMSFIKETTEPWGIYAGIPARRIKERKRDLLYCEEKFVSELK